MTGATELDGAGFVVDGTTRLEDRPGIGQRAELRAVVEANGRVRAVRLEGS